MSLSEYWQSVLAGGRSMISAATDWRANPLTERINRRLWGPWWPAVLLLLVAAVAAIPVFLPPLTSLTGFFPPLMALTFIPDLVREVVYSAPAFFAFVVVWRVRSLRSSNSVDWEDRTEIESFGGRFFDAGALPIAAATLLLAVAIQLVAVLVPGTPVDPALTEKSVAEAWTVADGSRGIARSIVIVALVAGILSVHRRIGAGFGNLLRAGLSVWGIHLGIGFVIPGLTNWWTYLPVIGPYAPQRTGHWAHLLFDLAVACIAWTAAREKCRQAPLWSDAPPPPPPPPPPPAK